MEKVLSIVLSSTEEGVHGQIFLSSQYEADCSLYQDALLEHCLNMGVLLGCCMHTGCAATHGVLYYTTQWTSDKTPHPDVVYRYESVRPIHLINICTMC